MDIREYGARAGETALYPAVIPENASPELPSIFYCTLKLNGEAGEVAEQVGKALRDDGGKFTLERVSKIKKELGDVYWYLARLCHHFGFDPNEVLRENLEKLAKRKFEGKIHGSGSDR